MSEAEAQVSEAIEWMRKRGFRIVVDPYGRGYSEGFDPKQAYEFMRADWAFSSVFRLDEVPPLFNVAGLYWREIKPA